MGMSGADDGGVLAGGYGVSGPEGVRGKIWVAASAGRGVSDPVSRVCGPAECLGCVCDGADDRVKGGEWSGRRCFVRSRAKQAARLRWGRDEIGGSRR